MIYDLLLAMLEEYEAGVMPQNFETWLQNWCDKLEETR